MGSHLTAELLREGCSVRLIVRNAGKTDLLKATLRRMGVADRYDRIEFRQTALNNPHTLREAVRGTQVLFHCAAQVSFDPERADDIVSSNTEITTHIVNSCLECGVGLLVHCSSIATLGEPRHEGEPVTESCTLDSPVGKSAYAISKIYAENIVRRGIAQGLKAVIVNPAIVIGEGNWTSGSSLLIAFGARGGFFYTRGVKSYVDVRDVARAMVLLAQRPETGREPVHPLGGQPLFPRFFRHRRPSGGTPCAEYPDRETGASHGVEAGRENQPHDRARVSAIAVGSRERLQPLAPLRRTDIADDRLPIHSAARNAETRHPSIHR